MSGPTRVCLNRVSKLGTNLDFPIGEIEPNPGHKKAQKNPMFVFVCAGGTLFPLAVQLFNWVALKGCYVTPEHVTKLAPNLDSGLGFPVCAELVCA